MALVNFTYNGIKTEIQYLKENKLKDICNKYISKIDKNIDSLIFLYNGNKINYELTFYEEANSLDKPNLEMNILVINNDDTNELKCPKCGNNLYNNKLFNDLIKYNKNINTNLNELKSIIELISVNDINNIENKKVKFKYLINQVIKENEKMKNDIQKMLNINTNKKIITREYKNKEVNNCFLSNGFNIKNKNHILQLKYHTDRINCAIILNDGRFATCSNDKSIIIYNKKTFKPEIIIKEHKDFIKHILQLNSGNLASCSLDGIINIFYINNNNYKVLQTLKYHQSYIVNKIIELKNGKLVSCSNDSSIIIYSKDNNNKYIKDYLIETKGEYYCIIQTKENEICYHTYKKDNYICFYDLLKNKIINKIKVFEIPSNNSFNMVSKDLLLITGYRKLYLININQRNSLRIINVPNSSQIGDSCLLNRKYYSYWSR